MAHEASQQQPWLAAQQPAIARPRMPQHKPPAHLETALVSGHKEAVVRNALRQPVVARRVFQVLPRCNGRSTGAALSAGGTASTGRGVVGSRRANMHGRLDVQASKQSGTAPCTRSPANTLTHAFSLASENRIPKPSPEPCSSIASPRAAAAWRAEVAVGRGSRMDGTSSSVICSKGRVRFGTGLTAVCN